MNILAAALMLVMPFLRPCWCGEFTMICQCAMQVESNAETANDIADHCGSEHHSKSGATDSTPDTGDEKDMPHRHQPEQEKPCTAGVMLPATAVAPIATVLGQYMDDSVASAMILPESCGPQLQDASVVQNQPPPVGLLVVQTHFLRI